MEVKKKEIAISKVSFIVSEINGVLIEVIMNYKLRFWLC